MTQAAYDISVIICAYTEDRWNDLVAAIESVQQQTLPPEEFIVVIDHNPGLLMRAREYLPGVVVVENMKAPGLSGTRNSGIAIARSQIVAFLDRVAQQWPDSIWFYTPWATIRHRVPDKRARGRYFLWRCYDEGLAKAALVGLYSEQAVLASERTYAFKTLPRGVMHGVTDALFHHDLTGLLRAGAIVVGLAVTTTGYLIGTIARPLVSNKGASIRVDRNFIQSQDSNNLIWNTNEKPAVVRETEHRNE